MPITTDCPRCSRRFALADEMAGRQVQCVCGNLLIVPSPANAQQASEPLWRVMTPDGQVHGPVSKLLLDQAVAAGRLGAAAHIIREDWTGWRQIVTEYPHLGPLAHAANAPPLPPRDFCQRCRTAKSPWALHCPACGWEDPHVKAAQGSRIKDGFWRAYDQFWGSTK